MEELTRDWKMRRTQKPSSLFCFGAVFCFGLFFWFFFLAVAVSPLIVPPAMVQPWLAALYSDNITFLPVYLCATGVVLADSCCC